MQTADAGGGPAFSYVRGLVSCPATVLARCCSSPDRALPPPEESLPSWKHERHLTVTSRRKRSASWRSRGRRLCSAPPVTFQRTRKQNDNEQM